MQVLMQPLEVIALFSTQGILSPLRFKLNTAEESVVITIDQIHFRSHEKSKENPSLLFRCQGNMGNIRRIFELKYEIRSCQWFLYRA